MTDAVDDSSLATAPVTTGDIVNSAIFASLWPVAWLAPERTWWPLGRRLADAHIRLRGSKAEALARSDLESRLGTDPKRLERDFLSGVYVEILQTIRAHRPDRPLPKLRLLGREILDEAREAGRGAVLWTSFSTFGGLMVKRALAGAGTKVVSLRSYQHPYSSSRFGLRVLNPIRTRIENRFIGKVVTLYPGRDIVALRELMRCLNNNDVIEIAANSESDSPLEVPFMGGTVRLALGAPTLARLCGAPLIPVFTRIAEENTFEVEIEPALELPADLGGGSAEEALAKGYVRSMEANIPRCPYVWRGWFSNSLWRPDGSGKGPASP